MNEEIEQFEISLELLRIMFSFVSLLGKPNGTTINEFYTLNWELENSNTITLRFRSEKLIDYVLIVPDNDFKTKKRKILNGSMSYENLIQYIQENIWY